MPHQCESVWECNPTFSKFKQIFHFSYLQIYATVNK
nr:MAG TPA: hypothetical protein [Caudoviricetes sp.]